jgi:peroxiredoxin 2/4
MIFSFCQINNQTMPTPDYHNNLPNVGDKAPVFEVMTSKGLISYPDVSEGCWCIFFAHPANFTSAWSMYSSFLAIKERWFNSRNTKLLALSNEPMRSNNEFQDKIRRYVGIYLKAPIVEDLDFSVANLYGMAYGRRTQTGFDRVIFIIDPQGVIRLIIRRPLPNIENAIQDLERELDRMQGNDALSIKLPNNPADLVNVTEIPDVPQKSKPKPAYFSRKELNLN